MEGTLTARAATIYDEDRQGNSKHPTNLVELRLDGRPAYFLQDLGNPSVYHFLCTQEVDRVGTRMDKTGAQQYDFEGCCVSPQILMDTIFENHDQIKGSRLLASLVEVIEEDGLKGSE